MAKKKGKDPRTKPKPRPNQQLPNSMIRPLGAMAGVEPALDQAREYPVYGCWMMESWEESMLTPVIVARLIDDRHVLFASYLVDLLCLGVKDAFTRYNVSLTVFERDLPGLLRGEPVKVPVELAHEVVYGALEFAERLGLEPHPDFHRLKADMVLDPPDMHPRTHQVEFGRNGRPMYVPGPNDNALKVQQVMSALKRSVGEGNFDVLQMM